MPFVVKTRSARDSVTMMHIVEHLCTGVLLLCIYKKMFTLCVCQMGHIMLDQTTRELKHHETRKAISHVPLERRTKKRARPTSHTYIYIGRRGCLQPFRHAIQRMY